MPEPDPVSETPLQVDAPQDDVPGPRKPGAGEAMGGSIAIVAGLCLATLALVWFTMGLEGLLVWGVAQGVWAVPLCIYARVTLRNTLFRVALIGAGVAFLLHVTCTVIVFSTAEFGG